MTMPLQSHVFREHPAPIQARQEASLTDIPDRLVIRVIVTLIVASVVFQTFMIPLAGSNMFIDIIPLYIAIGVLFFSGKAAVSATRLLMFGLSFGPAMVLQTIFVKESSLGSMLLAFFIYATYIFTVDISKETYFKIIDSFQYVVISICFLVYLDIAVQLVHLDMPDINKFVPASLLVQSYIYIQPLLYGSHFMKPNAFFMLEASFASQFIALGLVIELSFFRRWRMIIVMIIALIATFAATGVLLVLTALPFVGRRYWRQALACGVVILPLLLLGAYTSGWLEVMQTRAEGIDRANSSFSGRFILPYTAMWELARTGSQTDIIDGLGAGASTRILEPAEYTTISRSFTEYGLLFFVFFNTFLAYCFFSSGAPFIINWIVFINYNFLSGNFHLSSSVNYAFVLTAGYAIRQRPARLPIASLALTPQKLGKGI